MPGPLPSADRSASRGRRWIVILLALCVVVGLGTLTIRAASKRLADLSEIHKLFDHVVQCVRTNDVEGMRLLAGPGTWAWAESMLDAARHADAARFAALGSHDKITVLELRLKHTDVELAKMSAADILANMPLASPDASLQLVQIYIDGDTANATIDKITGNAAAHIAEGPLFTREGGQWRMEWHLIPIQILKNAGPPPSNDELRSLYKGSHPHVWDDRLLDGPR